MPNLTEKLKTLFSNSSIRSFHNSRSYNSIMYLFSFCTGNMYTDMYYGTSTPCVLYNTMVIVLIIKNNHKNVGPIVVNYMSPYTRVKVANDCKQVMQRHTKYICLIILLFIQWFLIFLRRLCLSITNVT